MTEVEKMQVAAFIVCARSRIMWTVLKEGGERKLPRRVDSEMLSGMLRWRWPDLTSEERAEAELLSVAVWEDVMGALQALTGDTPPIPAGKK